MQTNPLLLVFMALGVIFTVAIVVLAILQRRLLAEQKRAVEQLLEETRQAAAGRVPSDGGPTALDSDDSAADPHPPE